MKIKLTIKSLKLNDLCAISFIISLIPLLLISGPFLPDLVLSFSSLFFLFYIFKNKLFSYFTKKPLLIFFIFCLYCISVSIFVATDLIISFQSSLFFFRIGVFCCLVWYLIETNKKILSYFYYSLVICFSALIMDGFLQYFNGFNVLGFPSTGPRISSFFGDELIMGSYLSRLFPLMFALFIIKPKKNYEPYFIAMLFILADVLIYVSGERAAFFFLNISTIFIIIFIKKYQKFRLVSFLIAMIIIVLITQYSPQTKNRMINETLNTMGLSNVTADTTAKKYIFTKEHDSLYRTSFKMFLDKPIFGHGPKMFRIICKDEKYATGVTPCMTHPHNFYIQLLVETGIIGFLFLLSTLIYVIYCSLRQLKTIIFKEQRYLSDYQVCLLACLLITVWPLSPNGNFFNNWLMVCYSLPVGFYLHSIYGRNKEEVLKE